VEEEREEVTGVEYLLELLGYAIGIGNLWRFPYLVGKWGGGAFVLAYLTCLVFVSIPAYLFEMVWGQSLRENTVGVFMKIHPRWKGLAYGQAFMLFMALGYYNILLAYSCIYIIGSLSDPLPWNDDSTSYWNDDVLNNYGGDYSGKDFGPVQWKIAVALLAVWVIVFFAVAFGKRVLSKVTWVTVVGPIVMLFVLLIRAVALDGAADGMKFYLGKFDGSKLTDIKLWAAACGQILFSLSPGMGTTITVSSYTNPKQDVYKTCMTVALANSSFSLIGGIAIFSIVGNITYRLNEEYGSGYTTVAEQAKSGTGLAFIAIADGIKTFGSGTNMMAVLFFMVLLSLGLDSTFAWAGTFIDYVRYFLKRFRIHLPEWQIVGITCVILYLCGLPYCTRMGNELLDVVDHYVVGYFLLFGVAIESVMFTLDYKWPRLLAAIKVATFGNPATPRGRVLWPEWYWRVCIHFLTPAMTTFLFFYNLETDAQHKYENYPDWCQGIGWCLFAIPLVITLVVGFRHYKERGSLPPLDPRQIPSTTLHNITEKKNPYEEEVIAI